MATAKRRSKKGAKKGSKKGAKKGKRKGARKGVTKSGKVRKGARSSTIAAALNRIESRVDVLEKNDAATFDLLLGMANHSRRGQGMPAVKTLPGFVKPRLYRGGYGHSTPLLGG